MTEEHIHKQVSENPDSITIGAASKGGAVKIYFDLAKPEEAKKKVDAAKELRDYARLQLE